MDQNENKNSKASNSNQKLLVGLIIGMLVGLLTAFYFLDYFPVLSTIILNFFIALFILTVIGILVYTWFKEKILNFFFGEDFQVQDAKEESQNIVSQIIQEYTAKLLAKFPQETQEKAKKSIPQLLKLLIWSYTRSWALRILTTIFLAIGGLMGTILLYNQNQLLLNQNQKIDTQNERITVQNRLIEAERRGSLVLLMSNIMDQMNAEINKQKEDTLKINPSANTDTLKYQLSDPLIGRITSLSQGFLPYRYLEGDTLSAKKVIDLFQGLLLWH